MMTALDELFLELDKIILEEQLYEQYGFIEDNEHKKEKRKYLTKKLYSNTLTEEEIEENIQYMNYQLWKQLWAYKKCSEPFMEKYIEHINMYSWYDILTLNNNLSESFIEKYTDDNSRMYWDEVCEWQRISKDFAIRHLDDISVKALQNNKFINQREFDDIYVALIMLGRP